MAQAWNPSQKSPNIVLSGSPLLTATQTTTDANGVSVFAAESFSAGKFYWEIVVAGTGIAAAGLGVGIGNTSSSAANATFIGTTTTPNSLGWYGAGNVSVNSVVLATWATYATGNRLSFEIDLDSSFIRGRVNGGTWSANLTIPPAVLAAPVVPAATLYSTATPDSVVASFAQASWSFTPTAGFGPFDPVGGGSGLGSVLLLGVGGSIVRRDFRPIRALLGSGRK